MTITRTDKHQVFDASGNLLYEQTVDTDITSAAVSFALHAKARQALAGNTAALANLDAARSALAAVAAVADQIDGATIGNMTAASTAIKALARELKRVANVLDPTVVQTGRALRQSSQIIRLHIGGDLLVENTDT